MYLEIKRKYCLSIFVFLRNCDINANDAENIAADTKLNNAAKAKNPIINALNLGDISLIITIPDNPVIVNINPNGNKNAYPVTPHN